MNYTNISESEYCNIVIKRIKEYMHKNEIKQLDLSHESNINQSTLSKIMNGETKLTLQHIFRICNALKVDPEILLSFDQEIVTDTRSHIDTGIINKRYLNDEILIRNTMHSAFKGYITDKPFFIYLYSTISSESSLLKGEIKFEDTEYHNYCKATMSIQTGKKDNNNNPITKDYYGELIISLTMGACYCILINSGIGELCTLNFKHVFLFNQELICRVATVISTSSGTNKLPIVQRAIISKTKLNVDSSYHPDFEFARGQLKLNESEIIIKNSVLKEIATQYSSVKDLTVFFEECKNYIKSSSNENEYVVLDENIIRSINIPLNIKAQAISILRNNSIAPKYNKISTKTEEFTFQYICNKNEHSNTDEIL